MARDPRLANRILLGLGIGAVAGAATLILGSFVPGLIEGARSVATAVLDPFGQIFLRLLFFVVIPLVFASLAAGVAQLGRLSDLGPLTARTFALFMLNMTAGAVLGLIMMNVLNPGGRLDDGTQAQLAQEFGGGTDTALQVKTPEITLDMLVQMFMPHNLFGAFVGNNRDVLGEVLPLILFALVVGAATSQLGAQQRSQVRSAFETTTELMTGIVNFALRLAPYAVPAMIFSVVVKIGFDILIALGLFVVGCVLAMAVHLFGTMSLWLKVGARRSPADFFRKISPVLVTAFSTSSSNATLPTTLATARDSLGIRASTAGFVLPLGATMNMSGTVLYEGCVVLFVAQVFGLDLTFSQQVVLLILSVISSIAAAGIPGGSLPMIAGLLVTFGVPPEGIGIVLGADRLLDMARTTVNVAADLVTAAVVDERMAHSETSVMSAGSS